MTPSTFNDWLGSHDPWGASQEPHDYKVKDLQEAWNAGRRALVREMAMVVVGEPEKKTPAEAGAEGALLSV